MQIVRVSPSPLPCSLRSFEAEVIEEEETEEEEVEEAEEEEEEEEEDVEEKEEEEEEDTRRITYVGKNDLSMVFCK